MDRHRQGFPRKYQGPEVWQKAAGLGGGGGVGLGFEVQAEVKAAFKAWVRCLKWKVSGLNSEWPPELPSA